MGWHSAFCGVLMRCTSAALGFWSFFVWIFIFTSIGQICSLLVSHCLFFRLPQSKFDSVIFRECLDLMLFQTSWLTRRARPRMKGHYFPNTKSQTTDEGPVFFEHQEPDHLWRAKYFSNTNSQTIDEGPVFSEHQEPDHRWRISILRTPRARSPIKVQYSSNTKSPTTDEGPIF